MLRAIFGPVFVCFTPLFLCALIYEGKGPAACFLVAAAWFAWHAWVSGRNSLFVWRAIMKRQPWRDAYYQSLHYRGASRREAYNVSSWAWLHDPLMFVFATSFTILCVFMYFDPPKRSTTPRSSIEKAETGATVNQPSRVRTAPVHADTESCPPEQRGRSVHPTVRADTCRST
jgi:hypothetical protein